MCCFLPRENLGSQPEALEGESATRQKFRKKLREGELNDKEIEIEVASAHTHMEIFAPPGMEELTTQIQGMFQNLGGERKKTRKLRIREAMKLITDEEASKLINDEELKLRSVQNVEQNGIVFLDEIDKITSRSETSGADVSRQGVQRDLLPLVEGNYSFHQIRHDQNRSYFIHCQRGISSRQALRPDPGIAGALPHSRRT